MYLSFGLGKTYPKVLDNNAVHRLESPLFTVRLYALTQIIIKIIRD